MTLCPLDRLPILIAVGTLLSSSSGAQQPLLRITAPTDGTVVTPGQTVTVIATAAQGITFSKVLIIGEDPIGFSNIQTNPPFQFLVPVPQDISPGRYYLTASGVIVPGRGAESDPVALVVERTDSPIKMTVQPPKIILDSKGEQIPLMVMGIFADGSSSEITRSSYTTYRSNDANIAAVSASGVVTAAGSGNRMTVIVVSYRGQSVSVPVAIVTGPSVTVSASPASLWPPNGRMVLVSVSGVVNDSGGGIRLGTGRYSVTDEYGTVQPKGTVSLAANGSYFFTVLLEASRRGADQGGRNYTVMVSAKDNGGNIGSGSTVVVVPHDQGQ
jgi:hypothetical protein